MPKFSQAFLEQAASPGLFGAGILGLGEALKERRKEQERMLTGQQAIGFLNQATAAVEQGDVNALNMRRDQLMQLLSTTRDESARAPIIDAINQINAARPATQATATTNTANAIIKTEQALKDFEGQVGPLSEGQERAKAALKERLAYMRENSQAVIEADNIKYQTKFNQFKKDNELAAQQELAAQRILGSVAFESAQYEIIKEDLERKGMTNAISKFEKMQYELIESKDRADQIRESTEPLSEEEKQLLIDNGHKPTDNIRRDRDRLALIYEVRDRAIIEQANRNLAGVSDVKAHVETVLNNLKNRGDLPWNFITSDLYDKIDNLSAEEIDLFANTLKRPSGELLTAAEIETRVIDFIKTKFPAEYKDMLQFETNQKREQDEINFLTADLLAQAGKATRNDDGTISINIITPEEQMSGVEGITEEEYRLYNKEVLRRRGPITSMARAVFGTNSSPEARARSEESQQEIVRSLGRGI